MTHSDRLMSLLNTVGAWPHDADGAQEADGV